MQDLYSDIRPYHDADVSDVLRRLVQSDELLTVLLNYRLPLLPKWAESFFLPLVRFQLSYKLRKIHNIATFQGYLVNWITSLLDKTTSYIEVRGLENLQPERAYVWISNHRDIAMDPLLVNYSLHQAGLRTSLVAIGDNLLEHPVLADLMRLNKSFIVKRGISNKREKLRELQRLSNYIRYEVGNHNSIWIAQQEGRAKDGHDCTDTAVLKMLALHGRERNETFSESMQALAPVPLCIQYEWDPCDVLKAKELVTLAETGHYHKQDGEDTRSILLGLTGQKGRVVVNIGKPLEVDELASADLMAKAVDRQIQTMCKIFPVQRTALALLQQLDATYQNYAGGELDYTAHQELKRRLTGLSAAEQKRLLLTYAMPLLN
ncbi:MAG: 1-acyl-sn-glycerol-3-phosphate acyltransferase [Venatoribacter sp.]